MGHSITLHGAWSSLSPENLSQSPSCRHPFINTSNRQNKNKVDIGQAIAELRRRNEPVPKPLRLPTVEEVDSAERALGLTFPPDYRRYLLEASDVVFSTNEPCVVIPGYGYLDLVTTAREAWEIGVPRDWLPFCEDNADYFCLDGNTVRYWSLDGETDENWLDLGTWITEVWIGRR